MSYVGDRIPYKYVVGKGKKDDWEELVEFPSAEGRHVNRCLVVIYNCFLQIPYIIVKTRTSTRVSSS